MRFVGRASDSIKRGCVRGFHSTSFLGSCAANWALKNHHRGFDGRVEGGESGGGRVTPKPTSKPEPFVRSRATYVSRSSVYIHPTPFKTSTAQANERRYLLLPFYQIKCTYFGILRNNKERSVKGLILLQFSLNSTLVNHHRITYCLRPHTPH